MLLFGFGNNAFGDHMIRVFPEPTFFAGEFFKMAFGAFCASLLQALTHYLIPCTNTLYLLTAKGFTFAIGSRVHHAQIDAQRSLWNVSRGGRHIQRDGKVERPMAIEQVSLPLDAIHTGLLIAANAKRDKVPSDKGQKRHGC
jgi:hypothetical protein